MNPLEIHFLWWKMGLKSSDLSELIDKSFEGVLKDLGRLPPVDPESYMRDQLERLSKSGAKAITLWEDLYPDLLKRVPDPPPVLFCLGDHTVLKEKMLSIVGTRRSTPHGEKTARRFAMELSKEFVIVSGMAYGIDSSAHLGAMENGRTVAVLASGVDVPSPKGNYGIYRKIVERGCVLSVYPLGENATRYRFPERNSTIAGLSVGVLVVQAPMKSGALITANWALDFGRDVFSIPGDIGRYANEGTNWLIKIGAIPVTSPRDILEYYGIAPESEEHSSDVLDLIRKGVDTVEDLTKETGRSVGEILAEITELELKGYVLNEGGRLRLI